MHLIIYSNSLFALCSAARYRSAIGKSANQSPFNRKVVGSSPTIPYAQFVPSFLAVGVWMKLVSLPDAVNQDDQVLLF